MLIALDILIFILAGQGQNELSSSKVQFSEIPVLKACTLTIYTVLGLLSRSTQMLKCSAECSNT